MDMKQQEQEYQDIQRWLKGKKPARKETLAPHRTQGRPTCHSRAIRRGLRRGARRRTRSARNGGRDCGTAFAVVLVIISSAGMLTLFEGAGQQLPNTPLGEMAKTMRVFTQKVAYVVGGIAVALSGMRILFGGR